MAIVSHRFHYLVARQNDTERESNINWPDVGESIRACSGHDVVAIVRRSLCVSMRFRLTSGGDVKERDPVSYTHLTLPTILRV